MMSDAAVIVQAVCTVLTAVVLVIGRRRRQPHDDRACNSRYNALMTRMDRDAERVDDIEAKQLRTSERVGDLHLKVAILEERSL